MNFPTILVGEETYTYYPNTGYVCVKSQTRHILINLRAHVSFIVCETAAGTKIIRKTRAGHLHDFWCINAIAAEIICTFLCDHMSDDEMVDEYTIITHGNESRNIITSTLGQKNSTMTRYASIGSAKNAWDEFDNEIKY